MYMHMFSGLHPLAPYFTKLVADEVSGNLRNLPSLQAMLALSSALVSNPHVNLEHYIHQLLPPVLSCLVSKSIGELQLGMRPLNTNWICCFSPAEHLGMAMGA